MNNEKNSNFYKQNVDVNMFMDTMHDTDNTELILTRKKTRYTDGANKIIQKVQNAVNPCFLRNKAWTYGGIYIPVRECP